MIRLCLNPTDLAMEDLPTSGPPKQRLRVEALASEGYAVRIHCRKKAEAMMESTGKWGTSGVHWSCLILFDLVYEW